MPETPETCDVCRLVDPYDGQGDGIGSCDCPRCDCGVADGSALCDCPDDYAEWPPGVLPPDDDQDTEPDRPTETAPTRGLL